MPPVRLETLSKVFPNGVRAVDRLDFEIADGEFFALLGPSGCGKTTLLRMIAGLETPTGGRITIAGRDVTGVDPGKRDVAMVFQDYALYPHMTVSDNIAYPLKVRKVAKEERRASAERVAKELRVEQLLERRPGQLSGGQQQRVAVARAIAYEAGLFLFDEPLSNLDARLRLEARTFLKRLQKQLAVTAVYVTHDQSEALALADRVAVMKDGRIMQLATPADVYNRPSSLFVASFIGSIPMNLLPAKVEGRTLLVGSTRIAVPAWARSDVAENQDVVIGARPEFVTIGSDGGAGIDGTVSVVELLGNEYLITLERDDLTLQVTAPEAAEPGSRARAILDERRILLYRRDDGGLVGSPRGKGEGENATVDTEADGSA